MDRMSNDGIIFGMQVVVGEALGTMTEQEQSPQPLQQITEVNDFTFPDGQRLGDHGAGNQPYDPQPDGLRLDVATFCKPAGA